jgi:hypothetical protein
MPKFTADNAAELGRRGGNTTVERLGRAHMQAIGRLGFAETVRRHWGGDRAAYTAHLRELGLLAACDREFILMADLYRERGLL